MGLFFNTKSSSGFTVNRKRVSSSGFDREDIKKLGKDLNLTNSGARGKFTDIMMKAKSGGWTREEVRAGLQEMITSGKATKEQARNIAKRIGLEQDRFRKFKDISESRESSKESSEERRKELRLENSANKKEMDKTETAEQKAPAVSGNTSSAMKLSSGYSNTQVGEKNNSQIEAPKKSGSIWDILNRRKN